MPYMIITIAYSAFALASNKFGGQASNVADAYKGQYGTDKPEASQTMGSRAGGSAVVRGVWMLEGR